MNTNLPSKTALRKMGKPELIELGNGYCLFEHLNSDEVEAMTKAALVNEITGAFLRIEIEQEHVAAASDTIAKPVAEVIGLDEAPKAKRARKAKTGAPKVAIEAVKSISPSAAGRLGDAVGSDFIVRWPKGGADLLQRVAGEGAAWLVRCNAHGTTTEAANVKAADLAGRKAQRVVWCAECAAK